MRKPRDREEEKKSHRGTDTLVQNNYLLNEWMNAWKPVIKKAQTVLHLGQSDSRSVTLPPSSSTLLLSWQFCFQTTNDNFFTRLLPVVSSAWTVCLTHCLQNTGKNSRWLALWHVHHFLSAHALCTSVAFMLSLIGYWFVTFLVMCVCVSLQLDSWALWARAWVWWIKGQTDLGTGFATYCRRSFG